MERGGGAICPTRDQGSNRTVLFTSRKLSEGAVGEERGSSFRRVGLKPSETARSVGSAAGVCVWGRGAGGQQAS